MMEAKQGAFGPHARAHERLSELCSLFSVGRPFVRVYDDELHGAAILIFALRADFEQFVKDALWGRGQPRLELQPPSSVLEAVNRYVGALAVVEEYGAVQVAEVTDFVLRKIMVDPTCGLLGSRINVTVGVKQCTRKKHNITQIHIPAG